MHVQVGAEFLGLHYPVHTVLLPSPTWANHHKIFPLAGIKDVRTYRYFKPATRGLDYEVRVIWLVPLLLPTTTDIPLAIKYPVPMLCRNATSLPEFVMALYHESFPSYLVNLVGNVSPHG